MIEIDWHGRTYAVCRFAGKISTKAGRHIRVCGDEAEAVRWLCSHSLRKGKAKQLVADELVNKDELTKQAVAV
jgi:hypothetical protein